MTLSTLVICIFNAEIECKIQLVYGFLKIKKRGYLNYINIINILNKVNFIVVYFLAF